VKLRSKRKILYQKSCAKNQYFVQKNQNFGQKMEVLIKMQNLGQKYSILLSKFGSKIFTLFKNRNFVRKIEIWSKIETLFKNKNFVQKNRNFGQKSTLCSKI